MGKINVLSKNVSELIAAGEVVERPASIIKELLENCIDAKATAITIEIKNGGIRYIRVTDNGIGMEKEDLAVALLRHATSKISHKNDLESICTLGFRGEALASVCAVSKMEVITKQANTDFGYKITADAGQIFPVEQAGCQNGTTVIVKDLFYNVPARMKFLKRDSAEANVIGGIIEKIALSHSEISFKFISDGNIKILTPGNGKLIDSINTILGREIASNMLSVDSTNNGVKVSGFISKTNYTRTNRGMQHFFVNGRYVRSKVCMSAIEEGYKSSIMIGKFPLCVLNIEIPYNCVDINVHPAKIEVRFTDEKMVFDAIYFAVKQAILKIERFVPPPISPMKNESAEQIPLNYIKEPAVKEIVLEDKTAPVNSFKADNVLPKASNVKPSVLQLNSNKADYSTQEEYSYINKESFVKQQNKPTIILEEPEEVIENSNDIIQQVEFIYIGELFKTYIIFECQDKMVLVDKHAAHERIIYEKLKKEISLKQMQTLISPIAITLTTDEYVAVTENIDLLKNSGFSFEDFGVNTIALREIPMVLSQFNIKNIFLDVAQKISQGKKDISSDTFIWLLSSIACRSAIKANDISFEAELKLLLNQVLMDENIRHCPHGRPILTFVSKTYIENLFGR